MNIGQREELREILIDYLQVLTSTAPESGQTDYDRIRSLRIAKVRLLLKEVM